MPITMINEEIDILQKSEEVPVLVDFWAPWCGPCRFLSPIIEELAREANGQWQLVKVNTDEQPEFMHKYRIQGIPTMKMFYNRQVIGEQVGALPKHELKRWIESIIPTPEKKEWTALSQRLRQVDAQQGLKLLEEFVGRYPTHRDARILWLRSVVWHQPELALAKLEEWKDLNADADLVQDIEAIARLLTFKPNGLPKIDDLLSAAAASLRSADVEGALRSLIDSLMYNRQAYEELARKACIAIFHHLGEQHELTKAWRRRFSMALY